MPSRRKEESCRCYLCWMDLERHRVALLNKNSRHGSTMCIECRMRCAIAHF